MIKPMAAPTLLATLAEKAPTRLLKKLDDNPSLGNDWPLVQHDDGTAKITSDSNEAVTLTMTSGVVLHSTDVRCSCLLSPRCLHVLVAVRSLAIAASISDPVVVDAAPTPAASSMVPVMADMQDAARQVFEASSRLLCAGIEGAGAVVVGNVLRAAHIARLAGLYRLSSSTTAFAEGVQAVRSRQASGHVHSVVADLTDVLLVAHQLQRDQVDEAIIGQSRRTMVMDIERPHLRLHGVCCEAVVTKTGKAGVHSHLVDDDGVGFGISDIRDGGVDRALAAYEATVTVGGLSLGHRELARAGMLIERATVSADRRLGSGQAVRAVRLPERSSWPPSMLKRFDEPLSPQWRRACQTLMMPMASRAAGDDLVFATVTVVGITANGRSVVVDVDGQSLWWSPDPNQQQPQLWSNLALLARLSSVSLRAVMRPHVSNATEQRQASLLAVAETPEQPIFSAAIHGHVDVTLQTLSPSDFNVPLQAKPHRLDDNDADDVLGPMARRLERFVVGGRNTLPLAAVDEVEREARALEAYMMPTAAASMRGLAAICRAGTPYDVATAWLRGAIVQRG
jgi:hypothetical protein